MGSAASPPPALLPTGTNPLLPPRRVSRPPPNRRCPPVRSTEPHPQLPSADILPATPPPPPPLIPAGESPSFWWTLCGRPRPTVVPPPPPFVGWRDTAVRRGRRARLLVPAALPPPPAPPLRACVVRPALLRLVSPGHAHDAHAALTCTGHPYAAVHANLDRRWGWHPVQPAAAATGRRISPPPLSPHPLLHSPLYRCRRRRRRRRAGGD